jgi:predicted nucleic acid-binding protein
MLFDTDVLIEVFRGNAKAAQMIDQDADRALSVVGFMELLQGAADKRETRLIKDFLKVCAFSVLPLSENIGHRASIYMEEFGLSSGLRVADAIIAATAAENHLPLCTGDLRHSRAIRDLKISAFRP